MSTSRFGLFSLLAIAMAFRCGSPDATPQPARDDSLDRVQAQPTPGTATAPLANTYWAAVEIAGRPARGTQDTATAPHLTLDSAQKRALGYGGCNRFTGPYVVSGDSLRLGPLAATKRACLDADMTRQETSFLAALDATRAWHISGDTLILTGGPNRATLLVKR